MTMILVAGFAVALLLTFIDVECRARASYLRRRTAGRRSSRPAVRVVELAAAARETDARRQYRDELNWLTFYRANDMPESAEAMRKIIAIRRENA